MKFRTFEELPILRDLEKIENAKVLKADIQMSSRFSGFIKPNFILETEHGMWNYPDPEANLGSKSALVIRDIFDLLHDSSNDEPAFIGLSVFIGAPCRIIVENRRIQAIGHFIKDKWILTNDLVEQ